MILLLLMIKLELHYLRLHYLKKQINKRKKELFSCNLLLLQLYVQLFDHIPILSSYHVKIVFYMNGILFKNQNKLVYYVNLNHKKFHHVLTILQKVNTYQWLQKLELFIFMRFKLVSGKHHYLQLKFKKVDQMLLCRYFHLIPNIQQ